MYRTSSLHDSRSHQPSWIFVRTEPSLRPTQRQTTFSAFDSAFDGIFNSFFGSSTSTATSSIESPVSAEPESLSSSFPSFPSLPPLPALPTLSAFSPATFGSLPLRTRFPSTHEEFGFAFPAASAHRMASPLREQDTPGTQPAGQGDQESAREPSQAPRGTRFRFKTKHRRHRTHDGERERDRDHDGDEDSTRRRHRRSRRRHHSRSRSRSPRRGDSRNDADPFAREKMDPEAAFRESLFDAMADDEGAAYWEGVYGQPIHTYASAREQVNDKGELERMTDEEYTSYVRQKMWEKTHEGAHERQKQRERERRERERREQTSRRLQRGMEESLRRGEARRAERVWDTRWEEYASACARWENADAPAVAQIPWPLGTLEKSQRTEESLRKLFRLGANRGRDPKIKLKEERFRWHPDKMQQRLGGQVDTEVMKEVTATFQVVDKLLDDMRKGE